MKAPDLPKVFGYFYILLQISLHFLSAVIKLVAILLFNKFCYTCMYTIYTHGEREIPVCFIFVAHRLDIKCL